MNAQLKPERGIVHDLPASEYHKRKLDTATASGLKLMLRSPAHFKAWVEDPDADRTSPALEFGRAFHCATLEPDVFADTYGVFPADAPADLRRFRNAKKPSEDTLRSIEWWDAWTEANAGRVMLSQSDYDRARYMADAVRAHPVARGLLVGGDREVTFRWQDGDTGIACKARADLYASGEFLMDLKTCRDASHEGFARAVASYAYDLQAAHYVEGIRCNGDAIKWFVFLACESEAPYVCQPYLLDANAEQRGYALRRKAITRQAECLNANRWPGYSEKLEQITLPAYAFYGVENEQ